MRKRLNKIVSTFVAGVLCMSFVPLTAIASDEGIELTNDAAIVETVEGEETPAPVEVPQETEVVESEETPDMPTEDEVVNDGAQPEINLAAELDDTEEDIDPLAEKVDEFTTLKEAIENGSVSSIVITESMVATSEIRISGELTIAAAEGATISRDSQTHSIFVVEATGSLTLNGVKLASVEASGSKNSSADISPLVSSGCLVLNDSSVTGFVAANGGGLTVQGGIVNLNKSSIDGNQARNNTGYARGGGIYVNAGTVNLNNGSSVVNNMADSVKVKSYGTGMTYGGLGGGIFVESSGCLSIDCSSVDNNKAGHNSASQWEDTVWAGGGGGVYLNSNTSFSMSGSSSSISKNGAYAWASQTDDDKRGGGGLFIRSGNPSIEVNEGTFEGNFARTPGGGIYIHIGEVQMTSVAIVKNFLNTENGSDGGGLWFCDAARNGGKLHATQGALIADNSAYSRGADFTSTEPWFIAKDLKLPTRLPNGAKVVWSNDGSVRMEGYSNVPLQIEGGYEPESNLAAFLEKYQNEATIELKSSVNTSIALDQYKVRIYGNSASNGGGIACNGNLIIGEDKDVALTLKKEWSGFDENNMPNSIRLKVYNHGNEIDEVELTAENEWQTTLIDLPFDGVYTVKEVNENGDEVDEFDVSYNYGEEGLENTIPSTPHGEYTVIVTNSPLPSEGELTITKTFNGSVNTMVDPYGNVVGSATAVFRVEGYMPASADETESDSMVNEEFVEGEESSGGEEGSEDVTQKEIITDEDGAVWVKFYDNFVGINISDEKNSVTLTNLPVGAKFVVTEMIYDQSGFMVNGDAVRTQVLERAANPVIAFDYENTIDNEEHPNQGIVNRYSFTTDTTESKSVDQRWAA